MYVFLIISIYTDAALQEAFHAGIVNIKKALAYVVFLAAHYNADFTKPILGMGFYRIK